MITNSQQFTQGFIVFYMLVGLAGIIFVAFLIIKSKKK